MPNEPKNRSFSRSPDGVVKLGDEALRTMFTFVQRAEAATEAGGVLVGRHILGCNDVVVDRVTVPMPGDRRSRTRFDRARLRHQQVLDDEWGRSGGTCVYLGEWHSHPEAKPAPSYLDLDDWRRRLSRDRVDATFLLFVIVGQLEIRAWEGNRQTLDIAALRPKKEPRHDRSD